MGPPRVEKLLKKALKQHMEESERLRDEINAMSKQLDLKRFYELVTEGDQLKVEVYDSRVTEPIRRLPIRSLDAVHLKLRKRIEERRKTGMEMKIGSHPLYQPTSVEDRVAPAPAQQTQDEMAAILLNTLQRNHELTKQTEVVRMFRELGPLQELNYK